MEPYQQILPESPDPVMTLVLNKKTGNIPKGTYGFIECYCTAECDCRRVVLLVVNEKKKQKAVIDFGFDQQGPFAGPYLDTSNTQAPYAVQLLDFFVDSLNSNSMWLDLLYRHYRQVRTKVEDRPYRGRPFPKPGELVYRATPPPDLEAEMLESLKNLRAAGRLRPESTAAEHDRVAITGDLRPHGEGLRPSPKGEIDLPSLVKRYAEAGVDAPIAAATELHRDVRSYLLENEKAGEELASYLPELCRQSPQDDVSINAALRLLFDALNLVEEQMESEQPGARQRMEKLQSAVAQRVFEESEDLDLAVAVSNIVLQSRVDILPVLRRATTKMMGDGARRTDLHDIPGEEIMSGIARSLASMGVTSPFEGADELLQLFTMNEPETQVAIVGEMIRAGDPLLREMSALMLFTPEKEVRLGVARLLAEADGSRITPEALRRLIVSRNWLPEQARKGVDAAVSNARRARVDCAPLVRPQAMTVYATTIDGSGEQSFQVIVPDGPAFARCLILLKEGAGVVGASVVPLKGKGEVTSFITLLKKEPRFIESSPEHLDLRVCHSLADGARASAVPGHWLVRIAELLGRDRWKPIAFDAARELLLLWEELESGNAKLLDQSEYNAALEASGKWELSGSFLPSWQIADEADNDHAGPKGRGKGGGADQMPGALLEQRRAIWLERLVVTALLLKSCRRPPVAWHQMFHVAQAVADDTTPLRDIPLMHKIAVASTRT